MYKNIRFNPDSIVSCSTNCSGTGEFCIDKSNTPQIVIDNYINNLQKTFFDILKGDIPKKCEGCYRLTESKNCDTKFPPPREFSITCIDIAHWRKCNIDCVYCCFKEEKEIETKYDILDYLKLLSNYINDKCDVRIGGGEPAVLREFSKILNFFSQYENIHIFIMSNLTVWKNEYKKLLKENKISFTISLDCGNKELYKKIKQKNKFNDVIKNIRKCIKYSSSIYSINVKYIIIENLNDKRENIIEFINLIDKLGVKLVSFSFDRAGYNIGKKVPEHIIDLYNFAKEESINKGFFVDIDDRCEAIVSKKYYI